MHAHLSPSQGTQTQRDTHTHTTPASGSRTQLAVTRQRGKQTSDIPAVPPQPAPPHLLPSADSSSILLTPQAQNVSTIFDSQLGHPHTYSTFNTEPEPDPFSPSTSPHWAGLGSSCCLGAARGLFNGEPGQVTAKLTTPAPLWPPFHSGLKSKALRPCRSTPLHTSDAPYPHAQLPHWAPPCPSRTSNAAGRPYLKIPSRPLTGLY